MARSSTTTADGVAAFLQSQRQFWPAMTTRHASLAPISTQTFQRERRHNAIETPVGLYQHRLGTALLEAVCLQAYGAGLVLSYGSISLSLSTLQILIRNENIKVPTEMKSMSNGTRRSATWMPTRWADTLSALMLKLQWRASTSTMLQPRKRSRMPRHGMHAAGKPKKAPTDSKVSFLQTSRLITANTFSSEEYSTDAGLELCDFWAAWNYVPGFLREFNIWGCFGCLTVSHSSHLPPRTCRWLWLLRVFGLFFVFPVLQVRGGSF